jgi:arylsulfatase
VHEQVGRILNTLNQRKMLDNTLIVFFSDHGDMLGDQNLWRKSYAYEQSAHIPMLIRPAIGMQLDVAGQTIDNLVEIRDLLPTFLDAAGVEIPVSIEGKSLLHLVRTKGRWMAAIHRSRASCLLRRQQSLECAHGWKYIFHANDG